MEYLLKRRLKIREKVSKSKVKKEMLFRGKIKCMKCNGIYTKITSKKTRYSCNTRTKSKNDCGSNIASILESDLLNQITKDTGITDFTESDLSVLIDHIEIYEDTTFKIIYSN